MIWYERWLRNFITLIHQLLNIGICSVHASITLYVTDVTNTKIDAILPRTEYNYKNILL